MGQNHRRWLGAVHPPEAPANRPWVQQSLFERQGEWRQAEDVFALFVEYAAELNIDTESFAACMRNDILAPMQIRDYTNVVRAGITSTPYFIIGDSVAVRGAAPLETFTAAIDTLLVLRSAQSQGAGQSESAAIGDEGATESADGPDQ